MTTAQLVGVLKGIGTLVLGVLMLLCGVAVMLGVLMLWGGGG